MDLSSRESITACLDELGDERDRIDVLVNNAGEFTAGELEEQDLDVIYELMRANLLGPIHLVHQILPRMLRRHLELGPVHARGVGRQGRGGDRRRRRGPRTRR